MANGRTGVLLIQLGTPDAPTVRSVRRYLREFLGDPRVIEAPRLIWWFVLNFRVLPFRSFSSAVKYARIWHPETGSPLLHYTRRQAILLQETLGEPYLVRFGMRYGNPPVGLAISELMAAGVDRIVVLALYPQYSATTTASAYDAVFQDLQRRRVVPAIRLVPPFYADPGYIEALADRVRETMADLDRRPEKIVFSYHGIPLAYVQKGDPYPEHVQTTSKLLAEALELSDDDWVVAYQSRFGRAVWLQPYLDELLIDLARGGLKRVLVVQPGFTADCLETIDEVGYEAAELFKQHGGEQLIRCPCLNDHPRWIEALAELVRREACNWVSPGDNGA